MSQENVWNLEMSFVGSGEEAARANEIIVAARKRRKPIYGQGPWWYVRYRAIETRAAALAALSTDLDEIDPRLAGRTRGPLGGHEALRNPRKPPG